MTIEENNEIMNLKTLPFQNDDLLNKIKYFIVNLLRVDERSLGQQGPKLFLPILSHFQFLQISTNPNFFVLPQNP